LQVVIIVFYTGLFVNVVCFTVKPVPVVIDCTTEEPIKQSAKICISPPTERDWRRLTVWNIIQKRRKRVK